MEDFSWFERQILLLTGVDLVLYKENQMKRRIDTLIARNGISGYEAYVSRLKQEPEMLDFFLDYITINVTEFFRTPEHWKGLDEEVIQKLDKAEVWSVACSTGQEPYSLVMLMAEHIPFENIHVLATDINKHVLDFARNGVYPEAAMEGVPESYRERYFEPAGNGFRICDNVKRCVEFRKMDILREPLPQGFDLIACRNVLIYFTQEAKDRLLLGFRDSLKPEGVLFTGNTEQILNASQIGFHKINRYLYAKTT